MSFDDMCVPDSPDDWSFPFSLYRAIVCYSKRICFSLLLKKMFGTKAASLGFIANKHVIGRGMLPFDQRCEFPCAYGVG